MSYLVHAVYHVLSLFPGSAARTHRPCGRMGTGLRATMAGVGMSSNALGAWCARVAYAGFDRGDFGYFPVIVLGLVAVFLLLTGSTATVRALRNPAPARLPANVIAFRRPVEPIRAYQRRSVD